MRPEHARAVAPTSRRCGMGFQPMDMAKMAMTQVTGGDTRATTAGHSFRYDILPFDQPIHS